MGEIHPLLSIPCDAKLGPAMSNLNERQRAFVVAMVEMGGINFTRAALAAGYGNGKTDAAAVQGNRLAHDENIIAAIHEEAYRRLRSGNIMAVQTLLEIADNQTAENKDRLKACEMILNRSGIPATTEHLVKVERADMSEEVMIKRIRQLAEKQGIDPVKLLGTTAVPVDAEFSVIKTEAVESAHDDDTSEEDNLADIF